jgi:NADPH:quinone reductase-like Zn-dependent oxidoreductase
MLAAYVKSISPTDPLSGLGVGERPDPVPPPGWAVVTVRAAALNHHDLWALRGPGLTAEQLPMILGTDAAGVDEDGNEVIVYPLINSEGWAADDTLDPGATLLSDFHQGTLAEKVMVPRRNLIPKPAGLSFEQAACLPGAWLTAYRMLFVLARVLPGQTVLVQGAGGGVATAAIALGRAAGIRIWVTSRDAVKRERAIELGADAAFESGARLPDRVDAVLETVGEATWAHSLRALRPGGKLVVAGATTGFDPPAELQRLFFLQINILGAKVGTREELGLMLRSLEVTSVRPVIDRVLPLGDVREGLEALASGDQFGKVVVVP